MKLSKTDWNKLDVLLNKHGFGGYYDLVESLKIVIRRVGKDVLKPNWDMEPLDLFEAVNVLMLLSNCSDVLGQVIARARILTGEREKK